MPPDDSDVSVPATTFRAMQWLIVVLVSSAFGMSGWCLQKLISVDGRLSGVETKLSADGAYHDKTIDRIEDEIQRVATRLETKLDKLTEAVIDRKP